jgi:hydroxymethylglutaryl-CoA lyase
VTWPASIRVREVGPRDGLQSESVKLETSAKVELIDALGAAGLKYIEAVSFVSPKAVPQMADASDVCARMKRWPGVVYSGLVPNRTGAEQAVKAGLDALQVFVAATDTYNMENVGRPVRESMDDVRAVVEVGSRAAVPVEGTISTAFGCPYEGSVPASRVVEVSRWMVDEGVTTLSYGDTTGMATPRRVAEVVGALGHALPQVSINLHFHDTRGAGLANVVSALNEGIDYFDASIGGLGGSPFAAGATGNIATEDLVHMVEDMDIDTGVDLEALLDAARLAERLLGRDLPGKILRAGPSPD